MFGCNTVIDDTINVYVNGDSENLYEETKKTEFNAAYQFSLRACFFEKEHLELEGKIFGKNNDRYRTGFQVRRGGRLLTGVVPLLWNLSTGMNHAKGFRVFVDLPVSSESDEDWCVGTFKKITDDTWKNFNPGLRKFIEKKFADMVKLEEKDRKDKQTEFQKLYDSKLSGLQNINIIKDLKEELLKTKSEMESIMNDHDDKRLIKKAGKSYKSIKNYIIAITNKIHTLEESEADTKKKEEKQPATVKAASDKPVDAKCPTPLHPTEKAAAENAVAEKAAAASEATQEAKKKAAADKAEAAKKKAVADNSAAEKKKAAAPAPAAEEAAKKKAEEGQEDSKSLESIVSFMLSSIESVINNLHEIEKEEAKQILIKSIPGL